MKTKYEIYLEAENERLKAALWHLAECDLNESNCASLEVATRRVRDVALAALEKTDED